MYVMGNREEIINYSISKSIKFAPKEYKTRHDKLGKVIYMEL